MMGHNLAPKLNEQHAKIQANAAASKEIAAEIGAKLMEIKEGLKHGEFKPWIEENCAFSHKRSTEYMKVSELKNNSRVIFDEATSIRDALAKAKPKKKAKAKAKPRALDAKIEGAIAAANGGLTYDQIHAEYKDEAGENPSNTIRQTLARLVDNGQINVSEGTYLDPAEGLTPDDLNKTGKQKYEVMERRLKKTFEQAVMIQAQDMFSRWTQDTVKRVRSDVDALSSRMKNQEKLLKKDGHGIDKNGFDAMRKVLKAASRGATVSEELGRAAEAAFDALNVRPFTDAEIKAIEEHRKFLEQMEAARTKAA